MSDPICLSTDFASYQKSFTIITCAKPFNVHSFFIPPPRSTPWAKNRWHDSCFGIYASACQPGRRHNVFSFTLLHTPFRNFGGDTGETQLKHTNTCKMFMSIVLRVMNIVQGSRFFRFDTQNLCNIDISGVGALQGWRPLREILDPPLNFNAIYSNSSCQHSQFLPFVSSLPDPMHLN